MLKHIKTCSKSNDAPFHNKKRFFGIHSVTGQSLVKRVQSDKMEQAEHDLIAQTALLNTRGEFIIWE